MFYDDDPYADPVNVHDLFVYYNHYFFKDKLVTTFVKWSKRMTLCAGTCQYLNQQCIITLSEPLLKYRSNNDIKSTLLHEMIHAFLFMTEFKSSQIDRGHGPQFLEIADKINRETGLNITVFHDFHEEVDRCRKHIWKCNGICQQIPPYYGYVKRSMNRPPQPADNWWEQHQKMCGGTFEKIGEPENFATKIKKNIQIKAKPLQTYSTTLELIYQDYGIIVVANHQFQSVDNFKKYIDENFQKYLNKKMRIKESKVPQHEQVRLKMDKKFEIISLTIGSKGNIPEELFTDYLNKLL